MHNSKKEVRFGKRAYKYDTGFEGTFLNKFYNALIDFVQVSPKSKMLDIACGTGELLKRMRDKFQINGYGIDIDCEMVQVSKEKCPNMDIRTASCDTLPFEDQQFDNIVVCMAYHHFENKPGFAKEAYRVLTPGGSLYIADLRLPRFLRKIINAIMTHLNIVGHFYAIESLSGEFKKYGFKYSKGIRNGRVQIIQLIKN
jgi:Methylase involved in ubiquinone/menaquinone biosynthesis